MAPASKPARGAALDNRNVGIGLIAVGAIFVVAAAIGFLTSGDGGTEQPAPHPVASPTTLGAAPATSPPAPPVATTSATSVAAPTTAAAVTAPAPTTTTTTTPPTTTTAPPPSTTTTTRPETPEEFLDVLVRGLREDAELLVSRLNQATLDIYGAEQCLATFSQVLDPDTSLTIREIGALEAWDYIIDDIVTPLEDVLPVEVERLVGGQTIIQELHWKFVDGLWTWFSDCGVPLAE